MRFRCHERSQLVEDGEAAVAGPCSAAADAPSSSRSRCYAFFLTTEVAGRLAATHDVS